MSKIARASFYYMLVGIVCEFFAMMIFYIAGKSSISLSLVHPHILVLGMFFLLIVLGLEKQFSLTEDNRFKTFYSTYSTGLGLVVLAMLVNGVLSAFDQPTHVFFSYVSIIGYIILFIGFILFFQILMQRVRYFEQKNNL